ncbi:MAG: DUF167 domain-containing protein [Actinomycetota bacterium]|nr:DUF167 domain-containing protein [Actinomycetota bacterium]
MTPRSGGTGIETSGEDIVIRVRAPAAEGRATDEARRALAAALAVPPSRVALRSGARSRRKVFDVAGMPSGEIARRLWRR